MAKATARATGVVFVLQLDAKEAETLEAFIGTNGRWPDDSGATPNVEGQILYAIGDELRSAIQGPVAL